MSIRGYWQAWRCRRDRHRYTLRHQPIWSGGYYQCDHCGTRDVGGGDSYGPAAPAWIEHGTPPPERGLYYNHTEWQAWQKGIRHKPPERNPL